MVKNLTSAVQLSLFHSVKDTQNGCNQAARVSNYLCTREALWRLLASYPGNMTLKEAVRRARVDFTKRRKEVAV